jgi:hypothetical protein
MTSRRPPDEVEARELAARRRHDARAGTVHRQRRDRQRFARQPLVEATTRVEGPRSVARGGAAPVVQIAGFVEGHQLDLSSSPSSTPPGDGLEREPAGVTARGAAAAARPARCARRRWHSAGVVPVSVWITAVIHARPSRSTKPRGPGRVGAMRQSSGLLAVAVTTAAPGSPVRRRLGLVHDERADLVEGEREGDLATRLGHHTEVAILDQRGAWRVGHPQLRERHVQALRERDELTSVELVACGRWWERYTACSGHQLASLVEHETEVGERAIVREQDNTFAFGPRQHPRALEPRRWDRLDLSWGAAGPRRAHDEE